MKYWWSYFGSCELSRLWITKLNSSLNFWLLQDIWHNNVTNYRQVAYGGMANFGGRRDHVTNGSRHFVGQKQKSEKLERCLQAVVPLVAQVTTVRKREWNSTVFRAMIFVDINYQAGEKNGNQMNIVESGWPSCFRNDPDSVLSIFIFERCDRASAYVFRMCSQS